MAHEPPEPGAVDVDVWILRPSEVTDPALLADYATLLSPDERARNARFTLESARLEHLLGRALVRTVLARYTGRPAGSLAFTQGARGRPELVGSEGLRFNLTHTPGLLACAVTRDVDVGLDAEHLGRPIDVLEVGASVFTPDEFEGLRALPTSAQRTRFVALWTLKEAYLKARGLEATMPLGAFSFTLGDPAEPVSVRFEPPIVDDAQRWQFSLLHPTPEHLVAVAVRCGRSTTLRVTDRPHPLFSNEHSIRPAPVGPRRPAGHATTGK